jgi:hypothetical protein
MNKIEVANLAKGDYVRTQQGIGCVSHIYWRVGEPTIVVNLRGERHGLHPEQIEMITRIPAKTELKHYFSNWVDVHTLL